MSQRKLDIFELLRATDRGDGDWLGRQPADAQKDFAPTVVLRWAAALNNGSEAAYMLWLINERVNGHLYDLAKHPELIYRLIASCGLGKPQRHQWLSAPSRKNANNAATNLLLTCYPEANDMEISLLLGQYDRDGFLQFIDECGIQPTESKDVVTAYDRMFPEKAPKRKAKK